MRPRIFAVLAVSAFALVGCGASEPSAQPTVTVTVPAETAAPVEPSAAPSEEANTDEDYLAEFEQLSISGLKYDDSALISYGQEACEIMESGKPTPNNLVGDTPEKQSDSIIIGMAAKSTICPEVAN